MVMATARAGGAEAAHAGGASKARNDKTMAGHCLEKSSIYHCPTLDMEAHGSFGASGLSFCSSSMEMPSGERTKAM